MQGSLSEVKLRPSQVRAKTRRRGDERSRGWRRPLAVCFAFGGSGLPPASDPEEQGHSDEDTEDAGGLSLGHAEERAGIDADDFDKEAGNAGKDKVQSEKLTGGFRIAHPSRTEMPEQSTDGGPDE